MVDIVGGLTGAAGFERSLVMLYVTEVLFAPAGRPLFGRVLAWLSAEGARAPFGAVAAR